MHNMSLTCALNYTAQQTNSPHNSVKPTLLRNTLTSTQNITTLTTATTNIHLFVYYKIINITIIFLLQGAYKLHQYTLFNLPGC